MKMTVREIARRAGVSPATVSRVINGQEGMSAATRERVSAVLKEWTPTPAAGRKKRDGRRSLGILMPAELHNHRTVVRKLNTICRTVGSRWNLVMLSPDITPQELESGYLRGDLAGLFIFGYGNHSPEFREAIARIPHGWLNSHDGGDGSRVLMGNEQAGRLAARYLLENGCSRCAVLKFPSRNPGFGARVEGFRFEFFSWERPYAVLEAGEGPIEECEPAALERVFETLGAQGKLAGFDGFFSPEERLTPWLHQALRKYPGKRWPRLVSCNYSPELLAGLWPRPASIELEQELLAELTCRTLLRRIAGEPEQEGKVSVVITPRLVPGAGDDGVNAGA